VQEVALAAGIALLAQAMGARTQFTHGGFRSFQTARKSSLQQQSLVDQQEALAQFRKQDDALSDQAASLQRLLSDDARSLDQVEKDRLAWNSLLQKDQTQRDLAKLRSSDQAKRLAVQVSRNQDLKEQADRTGNQRDRDLSQKDRSLAQRDKEISLRQSAQADQKERDKARLQLEREKMAAQAARFRTQTQKFDEVFNLAKGLGVSDEAAQALAYDAIGVNLAKAGLAGPFPAGSTRSRDGARMDAILSQQVNSDYLNALDALDSLRANGALGTARNTSEFRRIVITPLLRVDEEISRIIKDIREPDEDTVVPAAAKASLKSLEEKLLFVRSVLKGAMTPTTIPRTGLSWGGHQNGRIPRSALREIGGAQGHFMMPEASRAMELLIKQARADGIDLRIASTYRDFDHQARLHRQNPTQTAPAGRSNHGWGRAVDFTTKGRLLRFDDPAYAWLMKNASRFGFINPPLLRDGRGLDEAWHWEFHGSR
jgi:LAS superfamily LD-carboxypeptidase LdcB